MAFPQPEMVGSNLFRRQGSPDSGHAQGCCSESSFWRVGSKYGEISWLRGFGVPVACVGPEAAREVFANDGHVFSQQRLSSSGSFFKRGLMFLTPRNTDFIVGSCRKRSRAMTARLSGFDGRSRSAPPRRFPVTNCWFHPYLKRTLRHSDRRVHATSPAHKAN